MRADWGSDRAPIHNGDRARPRRDGGEEVVEVEPEAAALGQPVGHRHDRTAEDADDLDEVRPGGNRHDHLVARPQDRLERLHNRLDASGGDREAVGADVDVPVAVVVAVERLAQRWQAVGVDLAGRRQQRAKHPEVVNQVA